MNEPELTLEMIKILQEDFDELNKMFHHNKRPVYYQDLNPFDKILFLFIDKIRTIFYWIFG